MSERYYVELLNITLDSASLIDTMMNIAINGYSHAKNKNTLSPEY